MADYTIIDANNDGTTWGYSSMSGNVTYNWSMTNAADEWLITPAIHLLAGKCYTFTVKARSFTATMPERIEVMMGTEPTAEAMQTVVIEPTEVASGDFIELKGDVWISTEGNYRFGIHAISDADNMMLAVDDIAVDESVNTGVSTVRTAGTAADTTVYSLDGRVMGHDTTSLPQGIYVQGGKKIVVR